MDSVALALALVSLAFSYALSTAVSSAAIFVCALVSMLRHEESPDDYVEKIRLKTDRTEQMAGRGYMCTRLVPHIECSMAYKGDLSTPRRLFVSFARQWPWLTTNAVLLYALLEVASGKSLS